ncbi:MAG: DUF2142 domain-containing protein [Chloroflexi bacterium]|nr:DUF2142 domain-containing protein [Chloroflexota bacterium]
MRAMNAQSVPLQQPSPALQSNSDPGEAGRRIIAPLTWPLVLVLMAYLGMACAYAFGTPPWQVPDEPAHYNYIRTLGDMRALPVLETGDYPAVYMETLKSQRFPPDLPIDTLRYESYAPPLYYIAAIPIYWMLQSLPVRQQVPYLRLFSICIGVLGLWLGYQIICAIFPGDPILPWAVAGLSAFVPMHLTMTGAINTDSSAEVILLALTWVCILRLRDMLSVGKYCLLGGILLGLAFLTKGTIYTLPVLAVGTEVLHWWIQGKVDWSQSIKVLGGIALIAIAISGIWFGRNLLTYQNMDLFGTKRHDAVVVGQVRTSEWLAQYGLRGVLQRGMDTTFRSFWGIFGWMGVPMEDRVYRVLLLFSGLGIGGCVAYLVNAWRGRSRLQQMQVAGLCLLALSVLLTLAIYLWYNLSFVQHQGRYLFPSLIAIMTFFALGWRQILPRSLAKVGFGLILVGLFVLDGYSLVRYIIPFL